MTEMKKGPFRSLANYIAQHRLQHPDIVNARTLTEARKIRAGKATRGVCGQCNRAVCSARKHRFIAIAMMPAGVSNALTRDGYWWV